MVSDSTNATLSSALYGNLGNNNQPLTRVTAADGTIWDLDQNTLVSHENGFKAGTYKCGNEAVIVYCGTNDNEHNGR